MNDYIAPRIGTVGFDGPADRTFATLSLLEYQESFRGVPSAKVLGRLRRRAGDAFSFVLRASCAVTHAGEASSRGISLGYQPDGRLPAQPLDTGELGQRAWDWTLGTARSLGASAIFLQLPASFRPTAENRRRLSDFTERLGGVEERLIWDFQGLWSLDDLRAASRELRLVPTYDPLLEEDTIEGAAYLRVLGRARGQHGLSADELSCIADAALTTVEPMIALNTPAPFRDARACSKLLSGG
ncbi:MAG: DUF72 domain-containing protein [bacterium]